MPRPGHPFTERIAPLRRMQMVVVPVPTTFFIGRLAETLTIQYCADDLHICIFVVNALRSCS